MARKAESSPPERLVVVLGAFGPGLSVIARPLSKAGFETRRARSWLACFDGETPDAIILVTPLIGSDELARLCARPRGGQTALLVIYPRKDSEMAATALEAGADDFICASTSMVEVSARVRAVLRKRSGETDDLLEFGGLTLDKGAGIVSSQQRSAELTRAQVHLLAAMMLRRGGVATRDELLNALGEDGNCFDRSIDSHITRLRGRLASIDDRDMLRTHRGVGYRLALS